MLDAGWWSRMAFVSGEAERYQGARWQASTLKAPRLHAVMAGIRDIGSNRNKDRLFIRRELGITDRGEQQPQREQM